MYLHDASRDSARCHIIIYTNDLIEHCDSGSDIFLFADYAKMFALISKKEDSIAPQQDLDKFNDWIGNGFLVYM